MKNVEDSCKKSTLKIESALYPKYFLRRLFLHNAIHPALKGALHIIPHFLEPETKAYHCGASDREIAILLTHYLHYLAGGHSLRLLALLWLTET